MLLSKTTDFERMLFKCNPFHRLRDLRFSKTILENDSLNNSLATSFENLRMLIVGEISRSFPASLAAQNYVKRPYAS
jgi:hypothetical protein